MKRSHERFLTAGLKRSEVVQIACQTRNISLGARQPRERAAQASQEMALFFRAAQLDEDLLHHQIVRRAVRWGVQMLRGEGVIADDLFSNPVAETKSMLRHEFVSCHEVSFTS